MTLSCLPSDDISLCHLLEIEAAMFFHCKITTFFPTQPLLNWAKIMLSLLKSVCRGEGGAFINTFYWLIDFTLDSWMCTLFFGLSFNAIIVYLTLSISFSVHLLLFLSFLLSLSFLSFTQGFTV